MKNGKCLTEAGWVDAAILRIKGVTTMDELTAWWKSNTTAVNNLNDVAKAVIIQAKDDKKAELGE